MNKQILNITIILSIFTAATGFISYYNLQKSEKVVFAAWSDLDANLHARAELVPNLVNAVKNYTPQENATVAAVIEARSKVSAVYLDLQQISNPEQVAKFVIAQQELQNSLASLLLAARRSEDLQTDQHFLDLQHQLERTENRINLAASQVNDATRDFNSAIHKMPGVVVNKLFLHLEAKEFFGPDAKHSLG